MKKLFLSFVFVALSAMTFAQQWTSLGKSSPAAPEVKLVSSNEQQVVIDFSLGGFNLTKVSTSKGIQQIASVPNMASMLEAGAPDLPQFPVPAIIGDMAEMIVSVTKSDYTDYSNVEIAPSKGNFSRKIDPQSVAYTYGAMYGQNAFWPSAQAILETPYIIRDFRGQNIMVRPFAYNPMTKTLRVYHHMTIEMKKVSDNGVNQKSARKATAKVSPEMKAAYESRFINYKENGAKYNFLTDKGEMLVICPEQYMEAMQPLVDWKNQSGRPTTMVSVTDAGGNNDNNIKSYISNIYNDPSHNLCYILLVGDYNDLTPHSMNGGRSDNWFGQLEGNDNYLEALVGRFSAQNAAHVATQVEKVIYYERDIKDKDIWVSTGIGIAANEGDGSGHFGEADYVHMNYIRDTLMHYTYEEVTKQYSGIGSGTSAAAISADVNNGASIINYCNHGSQTMWVVASYSINHVNNLVNDYKWPFVWSTACDVGKFQGDCFAEAWMRATNNTTGAPTGAVGGMFSWISQPWQPPMYGQDEMNRILTGWKGSDTFCHTLGGASLNGTMYILDAVPDDSYGTHNTWLLFGDPSLMVRTDNPVNMNLSLTPSTLMMGMTSLIINAENTEYGIATLTMDGEVIATGEINDGNVVLDLSGIQNVGSATLTVIGYNKVTEVIPIEILPSEGAYVTVESFSPGLVPVNVETDLSISFKNIGVEPTAEPAHVTINCADDRLRIINGTGALSILASQEVITMQDAFSLILDENVEDGTRFKIEVSVECGDKSWSENVFIKASNGSLAFNDVSWDGQFIPGDTLTFVTHFKNIGHYMASNAIISANCTNEHVNILNSSIEVGTVDPEGVVTGVFKIEIDSLCPENEHIPLTFTMEADGGLTASGSITISNSCKIIFELNDSYSDGWNGNALIVSFSDGTPDAQLTITSGSSKTVEMEVTNGTHITLTWRTGQYAYECSFRVLYENGDVIYEKSSPNSGLLYEFDVNCNSSAAPTYSNSVENLEAEIGIGTVTLTWDAIEDAVSYTIYRNGIEIAQTLEPSYVDEVFTEYLYSYCVIANYAGSSSLPECVVVKSELNVNEGNAEFSIYPNPVNNTLNICLGNAQFSYSLFNALGQQLVSGFANGSQQINVASFEKGVYFLRLVSGSQIRLEKIVVE